MVEHCDNEECHKPLKRGIIVYELRFDFENDGFTTDSGKYFCCKHCGWDWVRENALFSKQKYLEPGHYQILDEGEKNG